VTETGGTTRATWEADAVVADGGVVHIRPITPTDAGVLRDFHERLSDRSRYFRFFSPHPTLSDAEVERFTTVDFVDRVALVAEHEGRLVGVGRYDRTPGGDDAEAAFVVADAHQGRGVGTLLLEHLTAIARRQGVRRFTAEVLADNRPMLDVFQRAGFAVSRRFEDGVMHVEFAIAPTDEERDAVEGREHASEARSVARLLAPRSIAVVGASRRTGTVGNAVITNLSNGGFAGDLYAVNPRATEIAGVRSYRSLADIDGPVDLVVMAVAPPHVLTAVEEGGAKGARGLLVLSAGFAEVGPEGAALQRQLVERARFHGMRLIGPNCLGAVNTAPDVAMNATFAGAPVRPGRAGFMSQSGALGIAFLAEAARTGLGVSTFVSVGNKADVSGNDLLQYWEDDEATGVVLLYLESFGNPRKFARIARRISGRKPVVALKSGRTPTGRRAAQSHTAALATPDAAVDALFAQAGVIRVDTLSEMIDVARVAVACPSPPGRRVAIVGNSGGPAIIAADAAAGAGLDVVELGPDTQARLRELLGQNAAVVNPVDTTAAAGAELLAAAVDVVVDGGGVDAVVMVFTPTLLASSDEVAEALEGLDTGGVPLLAAFLATEPLPRRLVVAGIPAFPMPEEAVAALGRLVQHAAWARRPRGSVPDLGHIDAPAARAIADDFLAANPGGGWLDAGQVDALLSTHAIPIEPVIAVASAEAAAAAARRIGGPVVVKGAGPDLLHKSDAGAVIVDLATPDAAAEAYRAMAARLGSTMQGGVVQRMAAPGVETIVGVLHDDAFGPLLMFGMGGTAAELLADRSFRILPLTDLDAGELVRSVKGAPLLLGYRGRPVADVSTLETLLLRVARLAENVPELAELDLNPVLVSESGAVAVDARVRVTPRPQAPDVRRLRAVDA
jgi:acetyl coenzyme A synthetase (ADP forming)-like protein